ncbi:hypothetical protein IWW56_004464 [Coemansia sp. RSA 2131]|nr:hypothetical protein IWW56_004464 [Coemansia sp. RSA 2131]
MSTKVLSGRRNVHPVQALPVIVPGYELTFDMAGVPYWEPGFGAIQPIDKGIIDTMQVRADDKVVAEDSPLLPVIERGTTSTSGNRVGSPLHCVAFQITQHELEHIVNTEGGSGNPDFGYKLVSIPCETYGGQPLVGMTLINSEIIATGLHPSPRYLGILLEGADEHGLELEYVARLNSITPFVAQTLGQKVAKYLTLVMFLPVFLPVVACAVAALVFNVKTPRVMAVYNEWVVRGLWGVHACVFAPVFGRGC